MAVSDDEAAIRQVIDDMYRAIWRKDMAALTRCHVETDYARRWAWWLPGTLVVKEGWPAISARLQQVIDDPRMPDGVDGAVERRNFNIRIMGDMAWVTFDQEVPQLAGWSLGVGGYSREMRVMEKHDGQWKVAFFAAINRNRPEPDHGRFRLDRDGKVLWRNEAADEELREGWALVLRAGRLRARDRHTDRALQAAIAWVASLNLGFAVERGAVPILPEPGEDERSRIWWVTADAGVVEVTVGDRRLPDDRLALAAALYGLSAVQAQIARGVVAGDDLPTLAGELGISINTARTHLRRLFDKVGVRNQTALVRVLLTVSTPE
jgi:DNA-binding CsgD family transcriptional regulator